MKYHVNLTNVSREDMLQVIDSIPDARRMDKVRVRRRARVGNYGISIQASKHHYCEPRENLPQLSDYSRWEVAVYNTKGKMSCPCRLREKFGHKYEQDVIEQGGVFPYVRKQMVLDMIESLK